MALVIKHLWRHVAEASSKGHELLFRGMQVLGTARCACKIPFRRTSSTTHMPKSAMTMSDDGSLVRYKMFSGLPRCPS